jgi:hypothetical protein
MVQLDMSDTLASQHVWRLQAQLDQEMKLAGDLGCTASIPDQGNFCPFAGLHPDYRTGL